MCYRCTIECYLCGELYETVVKVQVYDQKAQSLACRKHEDEVRVIVQRILAAPLN